MAPATSNAGGSPAIAYNRRVTSLLAAAVLAVLTGLPGSPSPPATTRAAPAATLPRGWPDTLQLGLADGPGGAAALRLSAPYGFRYQYLAGGVNTGSGWSTWNSAGSFVTAYVQDSVAHDVMPVLTYYMIRQSAPGNAEAEVQGVFDNLHNTATMRAYWADMELLFRRLGAFSTPVVLHVEPDMWGYAEQASSKDSAASVRASVAATGAADLAGLPDTIAGFAQAVVRLRDRYAPNVLLGYHVSVWGTGVDVALSDPSAAEVDALATRAAAFYASLHASFDVAFAEFSDRDAAFKEKVYGDGGASWWDASDFDRHARFLERFVALTGKRIVLWQIPLGNTRMRAMDDTWGHYQDNRVEWLLDDASRAHLRRYADAGVVALLFGGGADGTTCACDTQHDGVTNPAPIGGNVRESLTADDDGGFFRALSAAYYDAGAVPLEGAAPGASATPAPTATPPHAPPLTAGWTSRATILPGAVKAGARVTIRATVRRSWAARALVDVEVDDPSGHRVFQRFFDRLAFAGGRTRSFSVPWTVPRLAAGGTYTVKVGVFSPGWGRLYAWNDKAARLTVTR